MKELLYSATWLNLRKIALSGKFIYERVHTRQIDLDRFQKHAKVIHDAKSQDRGDLWTHS